MNRLSRNMLAVGLLSLCSLAQADTKSALVTNVTNAENVLQTAEGRIFASGSDGLYELVQAASGGKYSSRKLGTVFKSPVGSNVPAANTPCYFTGLAVQGKYLYAPCFTMNNNSITAITARYLMVVDLTATTASATEIHRFDDNVRLPNGISFGPDNALYIADSGDMLFSCYGSTTVRPGRVLRALVDPATPRLTQVASWQTSSAHPNGVRSDGNAVYYTENARSCNVFGLLSNAGKLNRVTVSTSGAAGSVSTVYTRAAYLDDFELVQGGAVLTDNRAYTGTLVHVSDAGKVLHTGTWLNSPSAVKLLKTTSGYDLLTSEISNNTVSRYTQGWGLLPR